MTEFSLYQLAALFLVGYFVPWLTLIWGSTIFSGDYSVYDEAVSLFSDWLLRLLFGTLFVLIPWLWLLPVS